MKSIAIIQSNYIPWRGYFDIIASVDEFVLYDDAQFNTHNWRNRNRIKTPQGVRWLTIPVQRSTKRRIRDVQLSGVRWADIHWRTLESFHRRSPHFAEVAAMIGPIYRRPHTHLSPLNRELILAVCAYLGISTRITNSWEYDLIDGRSERLADICRQAGASEYVSGPSAQNYVDSTPFAHRGIGIRWVDYGGYPEYPQLWGPFVPDVTILDLLFNCGLNSPRFMKNVAR